MKILKIIIITLSFLMFFFHFFSTIYYLTPTSIHHRIIHLLFGLVLVFLTNTLKKDTRTWRSLTNYFLSLLSLVIVIYFYSRVEFLIFRVGFLDTLDYIASLLIVFLVIEASRQTYGWVLPIFLLTIISYTLFGRHLPGILFHPGFSIVRILTTAVTSFEGIFGFILEVSGRIIAIFIFFGVLCTYLGAPEVFKLISTKIGGNIRSGPGLTAVLSSAFIGSINGTATANVIISGSYTLPMMEANGYNRELRGAIEAAASTGGQIMPPIMGAGAFIMAEITGIPYSSIIISALLPAILYFFSVGFSVHMRALKEDLNPPNVHVPFMDIVRESYFLIPIIIIFFIVFKYTPDLAAFYGIISLLVIYLLVTFWKEKKIQMILKKIVRDIGDAISVAAQNAARLAVVCSLVGMAFQLLGATPFIQRFSDVILDVSRGNLFLIFLLTALLAIILGCGLPTSAAYLTAVSLLGTAMYRANVPLLSAHLFIFYYAILSCITPPMAIGVLAVIGLTEGNFFKTAADSIRFAVAGFVVPFVFVYDNTLLFEGTTFQILFTFSSVLIGIIALVAFFERYLFKRLTYLEQILMLISGILTFIPHYIPRIFGITMIVLFTGISKKIKKGNLLIENQ